MRAVENRNRSLLVAVLKLGANPNERCDLAVNSPLGGAVKLKRADMVRLLLEHGADPNMVRPNPRPPLCEAVMAGSYAIAQQLLSAGANTELADRGSGMTALHLAASLGRIQFVRLLLREGANINSQDRYRGTPLHCAQTLEICEFLIDRGADPNIRDKEGRTPIFSHDYAKVQLLLRRGANVNIKDNNGHTPLMWLVHEHELLIGAHSEPEVIQLLRDNGANPDECGNLAG